MKALLPMAAIAGILCMSSCSSLSTAAHEAGEHGREFTSDFEGPRIAGLFQRRAPVVEVREKDLKEMPLGEERALAFERKRRSFWDIFRGPVDFNEPDLPDDADYIDGSLLPPKD